MKYWSNFFCGVGITCFAATIIKPDLLGFFAAVVSGCLGYWLYKRTACGGGVA